MEVGEVVSDFSLVDQRGELRSLGELLGPGGLVLYFYPAALTKGCTAEGCHFRDLAPEFARIGANRVGISPDRVDKLDRFSAKYDFDFPLLSDPDGQIARRFGVRRSIPLLATRRWTFVLASDRRLLGVVRSEIRMSRHGDEAIAILERHARR